MTGYVNQNNPQESQKALDSKLAAWHSHSKGGQQNDAELDSLEGRKKIMYRTKHGKLVETADLMDKEEEDNDEANEIIRKF